MQKHSDVTHLASATDLEQNCITSEPKKTHKISLHVPFSTPDIK